MGNRPRAPRYSVVIAFAALAAVGIYFPWHRQERAALPPLQATHVNGAHDRSTPELSATSAIPADLQKTRARFTYAGAWASETRPEFLRFKRWAERYLHADPAARKALIAEGVELAKARRVEMAALIHRDPRGAIDATVPAAIRAQLPEEIIAQLERRISGRGDFEVVGQTDIGPNKQNTPAIFREVKINGDTYDAYVYGQRAGETTKLNIPLQGVALDRALAVHESALRALETDEPVSSALAIAQEPAGPTAVPSSTPTFIVQVGDQYGQVSVTHLVALASVLAGFEAGINPHPTTADLSTILSSISSGTKKADATAASLPSATWTTGPKKVLIALFNFPDLPGNPIDPSTNQAITSSAASSLITQAVNTFYVGSSYNKTSLTATADANVYQLPHTSVYYAQASNGSDQIMADARSLVSEKPDSYDRFIVVFSNLAGIPNSNITYAGRGYIGASGVWINGWYNFATVAHELGHNYGLNHANAWVPNSLDPVDLNGQSMEYGDNFDVMGSGYDARADFNMYHKNELGWIPDSATTTIASSGTYRVYRFDDENANLSNTLALKIVRNSTQTYWIGFRQQYTDNSNLLDGAYVVFGYQQDTNKQSDQITFNYQEGLSVGSYLCDQSGGFTIHTLKEGGSAPNEYLDIQVLYPTARVLAATNIGASSFTANWTADSNATGYSVDVASDQDFTQTVSSLQVGNQTSAQFTGLVPQTTYYYRVRGLGNSFQLPTTNTVSFTTTSAPLTVVHVHAGDSLSLTVPGGGPQTFLSWTRNLQSANNTFGPTFKKQNLTLQDSGYYQATPGGGSSATPLARFFVVVSSPHSEVKSWSFNSSLYSGDTISTSLHDLVQVAAGSDNLALLNADGTVYEWGDNSYGQNNIPAGLNDAVSLALGKDFTIVLHGDGSVSAWGRNDQGQCAVPAGLSNVAEIAAGTTIAVALKTDGTVVAWGKNANTLPALSHVTGIGAADDQIVDLIEYDQELFEWIPGSSTATQQPGYVSIKQLAGNNQELLAVTVWNTLVQFRTAPGSLTGMPPIEPRYIAKVATSLTTDLLLDLDGAIEAWGQNASLIPATSNVFDIAIGQTAAAAIVDDTNIPRFPASGLTMPATVSGDTVTVYSNVTDATKEQWQLSTDNGSSWTNVTDDGSNYSGSTTAALTVSNVSIQKNGFQYRLVASGNDGSATSNGATLTYYNSDGARLANVATRSFVGIGANVEIAGFIISGTQSKQVLIRAGGPSLTPYHVDGALADPVLTLYDGQQKVIGTNDDWDASTMQSAFATAHTPTWPVGSKDAAMLVTLQPGGYTAAVSGKNSQTGVALVEVYEYDSTHTAAKLGNLSTRSFVGTGASVQIAGFIISGTSPKHVLIRAGGPSLTTYGVDGVLADPVLTVYDNTQTQIATNDDWDASTIAPLANASGIPAWTPGSADAALYMTLNPGGYTAIVSGKNGATGVALIEVFEMP